MVDAGDRRNDDRFVVAGSQYRSRLILGTSRYPNPEVLRRSIDASGAELLTVSIRRMNLVDSGAGSILDDLPLDRCDLLPNTSGCFTAREAVLTAELAREALETDRIKLEVIGEEDTLLPDVVETLAAAEELVKSGFEVFPYTNDDLVTSLRLRDLGCVAVMPLASPIGSGIGLANEYNLALIREKIDLPMIVDAGIGTASDATRALELGADAVLVNSAVSGAHDPVRMATAMASAVVAGREAWRAGRIPKRRYARASSPVEGMIDVDRTGS